MIVPEAPVPKKNIFTYSGPNNPAIPIEEFY